MTLKHVALRLIAGLVPLLLMLPGANPVRALSSTAPELSRESRIPPTPASNVLRFERISLEQGLSQSAELTIYQDRQGYIWMGTEGGLNRFDEVTDRR